MYMFAEDLTPEEEREILAAMQEQDHMAERERQFAREFRSLSDDWKCYLIKEANLVATMVRSKGKS